MHDSARFRRSAPSNHPQPKAGTELCAFWSRLLIVNKWETEREGSYDSPPHSIGKGIRGICYIC